MPTGSNHSHGEPLSRRSLSLSLSLSPLCVYLAVTLRAHKAVRVKDKLSVCDPDAIVLAALCTHPKTRTIRLDTVARVPHTHARASLTDHRLAAQRAETSVVRSVDDCLASRQRLSRFNRGRSGVVVESWRQHTAILSKLSWTCQVCAAPLAPPLTERVCVCSVRDSEGVYRGQCRSCTLCVEYQLLDKKATLKVSDALRSTLRTRPHRVSDKDTSAVQHVQLSASQTRVRRGSARCCERCRDRHCRRRASCCCFYRCFYRCLYCCCLYCSCRCCYCCYCGECAEQ